jgi:hypothetical protein
MNARTALSLLVSFAACASEPPGVATLPSADANVVIDVAGDGFVRVGGRRIPLDAILLELRQRTRTMTAEERERFVVHLRVDPQPARSEAATVASKGVNRLVLELQVMGIGTAKVL